MVINPIQRLTLDEIMLHPWMNSECRIPDLLPVSTLHKKPDDKYIMQFVPEKFGGKMNNGKSGKDYDRALWAYTKNLWKGRPEFKFDAPH